MSSSRIITPLSRPASTKLRSSLVIPTFPQVLAELVQNSLDADAKRIDCWLDLTKGAESIRVEDDGAGIDRDAMKSLGNRYGKSCS